MQAKDLSNAIALAATAHAGQVDKGGEPYVLHLLRVMEQMDTIEEKIVAVLHDTLEDTSIKQRAIGLEFGSNIAYQVSLLTRPEGLDYFEYIESIMSNETEATNWIASKVKMADLRDNLNPLRQPTLRERDMLRLQKYHQAYKMLREHRESAGVM